MKIKLIEVVDLNLGNRDGELYAAKDDGGVCYLILGADSFCNKAAFETFGSTEHIEISQEQFDCLKKTT